MCPPEKLQRKLPTPSRTRTETDGHMDRGNTIWHFHHYSNGGEGGGVSGGGGGVEEGAIKLQNSENPALYCIFLHTHVFTIYTRTT